jgi:predicted DNA-binding helix-hairpin-helix protein
VEHILRVCGLGVEKRRAVASHPEMERLRVDQLPRVTVELLMSLFALSLSEAIDFVHTAKWIDVKRDVSLRLLHEANRDAWNEMRQQEEQDEDQLDGESNAARQGSCCV